MGRGRGIMKCPSCGVENRDVIDGWWWVRCVGCWCIFGSTRREGMVVARTHNGGSCWVSVGKLFVYDEELA